MSASTPRNPVHPVPQGVFAATRHEPEPSILDQILDRMDNLAIQQQRPSPVHLRTWEEIERFAEKAARSGMVPQAYKGIPDAIMIAVMLGAELGLAPMQSLQNIAVISGKPSIYGDAMIALVRASGKARAIREWSEGEGDAMVCWCEATRKDDPNPVLSRFGVVDAKKAGLWGKSGPWQQYPARMLQMRARGFALRDAFADVLHGVISAEEAADIPFEATGLTPRVEPERKPDAPASRPPVTERPKRQTAAEWLDEIAMELANAPDGVALDAIQDSPKYQRMKAWLPNDGMDRLIHMEQQAIERVNAAETTAPNDEAHAGTFADPDSDPFTDRVTA